MKNPPKHIAIIVNYFPTISETFIVNQVNSLIDSGCCVSLFSYNRVKVSVVHESLKKYDLLNKVRYFIKPPASKIKRLKAFIKWTFQNLSIINWHLFFKTLNVFAYGKDAYTLKLFFEAQWFLVPYEIELIHAHFGMVGNRIAYLKSKNIIPESIKLITTFHGYDLEPNKLLDYKTEYRYLFDKADAFTVNTPYLQSLLQQVNLKKKPYYILPVGLDTSFFKRIEAKKRNSYFDLVFCGKLIALKGPDLAIEILKKLHNIGYIQVRLRIIGDGIMRKQLEKQIQEWQLQDFVFLYEKQSQNDVKEHFEKADVFILPGRVDLETGRADTQGLVIQEAQAMELPVVVSDVGGMKYGLLPNESGFVVAENDLDGFVDCIERLILQPKLKRNMGKVGRQYVEAIYDNNILNEKLLSIYKGIIEINISK